MFICISTILYTIHHRTSCKLNVYTLKTAGQVTCTSGLLNNHRNIILPVVSDYSQTSSGDEGVAILLKAKEQFNVFALRSVYSRH